MPPTHPALRFSVSRRRLLGSMLLGLNLPALSACSDLLPRDRYGTRLYSPTLITRLNLHYFLVDCWHHRILFTDDLGTPLHRWRSLDENIAGPHSIASDGTLYVAEDTGRHGLKVYRETAPAHFDQVQYLPGIGQRPHRVLYDARSRQFLVLSANDQSFHRFEVRDGQLVQTHGAIVPELRGQYCRSITLHGDRLYFVGESEIIVYQVDGPTQRFAGQVLPLHERYRGSNDLFFLDESGRRGLFTATPGIAVRFESLDELVSGRATDLSAAFQGTPYYISRFDERLWIPEFSEHSAVRHYPSDGSAIDRAHAVTLFDYGPADETSLSRRHELPT